MARPAPGPDGLRRPLWLPRAFKPDASAYTDAVTGRRVGLRGYDRIVSPMRDLAP